MNCTISSQTAWFWHVLLSLTWTEEMWSFFISPFILRFRYFCCKRSVPPDFRFEALDVDLILLAHPGRDCPSIPCIIYSLVPTDQLLKCPFTFINYSSFTINYSHLPQVLCILAESRNKTFTLWLHTVEHHPIISPQHLLRSIAPGLSPMCVCDVALRISTDQGAAAVDGCVVAVWGWAPCMTMRWAETIDGQLQPDGRRRTENCFLNCIVVLKAQNVNWGPITFKCFADNRDEFNVREEAFNKMTVTQKAKINSSCFSRFLRLSRELMVAGRGIKS